MHILTEIPHFFQVQVNKRMEPMQFITFLKNLWFAVKKPREINSV